MKIQKKIFTVLVSAFAVAVLSVPTLTMAEGVPVTSPEQTTGATSAGKTENSSDAREKASTRLTEAKVRVCQNREKSINNILARIAERGQKQLTLFSSIATRTENFYTKKGKTLSNYAELVARVDAKKIAAEAAVTTVKDSSVTFKCDGTDPKGAAANFKAALKDETAALKEYKTAVKNLIVGVKSVQGTTASTENKTTTATGGNR